MKNILFNTSLIIGLLGAASCDNGFDELNTSKTLPVEINPIFQLNLAVMNTSFQPATITYEMAILQQVVSPNSGVLTGGNYNQDNRQSTVVNWQTYYRNVVRNTRDVIERTKDDDTRSNVMNMARILQAYAFMILTDSYGDIPYDNGGLGYYTQVFYPTYNSQEEVYNNIIQELTEASAALDAGKKIETSDVLYAGNIERWKKFGYSLLLRAGMRLSEVSPGLAESTVSAAFNGGVIISNADNAYMKHDANYLSPIGNNLNSTEGANYYLAAPFVDYLKSTEDPRLSAIAIRYVGAKSGPEQTVDRGNTTAEMQIGMPMGNDNATIPAVATNLGLASFYDFSQVDRRRMTKTQSPNFFVTASQSLLLLAEARERGWITAGTTEEYYNSGVRAHMEQLATYDAGSTVPEASIATYFTNHPFDGANAYEAIGTQYWISSFLNGPEGFANFRRTGFPVLSPNPYPGKDITGDFINRLTYPTSEISVNTANLNVAIERQGPDDLDTKVWWDVN